MYLRLAQKRENLVAQQTSLEQKIAEQEQIMARLRYQTSLIEAEKYKIIDKIGEIDKQISHPYRCTLTDSLDNITDLVNIIEKYVPFCDFHRLFHSFSSCLLCTANKGGVVKRKFHGQIQYTFRWKQAIGNHFILKVVDPQDIEILREWRLADDLADAYDVSLTEYELLATGFSHYSWGSRHLGNDSKEKTIVFPAGTELKCKRRVFSYREKTIYSIELLAEGEYTIHTD